MADFLDDILKRFRPPSESDEPEEEFDPPTEIRGGPAGAADQGPIDDDASPHEEEPPGSATELVRVPVRSSSRRRPNDVQGETPTENIHLSLEELVREINVLKGEIRTRDHELRKREQNITDLEGRFQELSSERERYQEKTGRLELQLNSFMTKLEGAEEKTEKITRRLKAVEADRVKSERLLAEAKKGLREAASEGKGGDTITKDLLKQKERFQKKSNQMEVQLNSLISQMEANQEEVTTAREEVERLRKERDRLLTRLENAREKGESSPSPGGEPSPARPLEEVHALEEKLTAILGGGSPGAGNQGEGGLPPAEESSLLPHPAEGLAALVPAGEMEETERLSKGSGRRRPPRDGAPGGGPSVEWKILEENRVTLQNVLSGGGVSPLGLGALVGEIDKSLHDGTVTAFHIFDSQGGGGEVQKLFFATKLSIALAREIGYEPVDVRKVGICALLILGNGESTPANIREEYTKLIAVTGAYGNLITRRPPMPPTDALAKILGYVDEGKLDGEYVRSFLKLARSAHQTSGA